MKERAVASLVCGAIGDAFGYPLEFLTLQEIHARHGPDGLLSPVFTDGKLIVSDDTQMTMFTLEGIINAEDGLHCPGHNSFADTGYLFGIGYCYHAWVETLFQEFRDDHAVSHQYSWLAQQPEMWHNRDAGKTCFDSLHNHSMLMDHVRYGESPIDHPLNNSMGCGGVMRVAPVGIIEGASVADVFKLGAESAALTHGHPTGYLAAGAMAMMVYLLLAGEPIGQSVSDVLDRLEQQPGGEATAKSVLDAFRRIRLPLERQPFYGTGGWLADEALAIGLYSALQGDTFTQAIQIAANHSGDSDTTASIAGQLWGAQHGLEGVPQEWQDALDVARPLKELIGKFNGCRA